MLTLDASHCNVCNTIQKENFDEFDLNKPKTGTFLKVLCVLTIVGGVIGLITLPFNYMMAQSSSLGYNYPVSLVFIGGAIALGKLTGAIIMLSKKLTGLYIYTAAAVCSIFTAVYSLLTVTPEMGGVFATIGGIFTIVFLITFLILYWLPVNRRLLS
jgi:hypothetical protein